ncbi:hypothetical protein [Lactococcus lactis]|uniref:hypothetical protein n=1 Tax=Lactococcus lactis TaxID=1358 RepID=UPI0022B89234|nr:hypothetical protein [Lactococcus lactis]MCZ8490813.1 hypothetical protein [Lactococcus lactis]
MDVKKYIVFIFILGLFSFFLPFFPATNNHFENTQLLGFQYVVKYGLWLSFVVLIVLLVSYFTINERYVRYKKVIPFLIRIAIFGAYGGLAFSQFLIGGIQIRLMVLGDYSFGYFISFALFLIFNVLVCMDAYKKGD